MLTRSNMLEHEFKKLIAENVERLKDNLALGHIVDISEYKNVTGRIAGLNLALDLIQEADAICNGKPRT